MHIETLRFSMDINGDGIVSRWEIWETVIWVYRLPGNLLIEGLGNVPILSSVLGIQASPATGYASLNGPVAIAFSLLFWLALLVSLISITSAERTASRPPKAHDIRLLPWKPDHKILPRGHKRAF